MFVRTTGDGDIEAVRELLVETWHATYDGIYGPEKVSQITNEWHSVRSLKARLTKPNSEFLVADDGKRIAGMAFAAADNSGKTVTLHQLYVRPDAQGRGVGGMLFDEILNSFHDMETVRLEVEEANVKALAFYKAYGFAPAGKTGDCGKAGSGIPALIMERKFV